MNIRNNEQYQNTGNVPIFPKSYRHVPKYTPQNTYKNLGDIKRNRALFTPDVPAIPGTPEYEQQMRAALFKYGNLLNQGMGVQTEQPFLPFEGNPRMPTPIPPDYGSFAEPQTITDNGENLSWGTPKTPMIRNIVSGDTPGQYIQDTSDPNLLVKTIRREDRARDDAIRAGRQGFLYQIDHTIPLALGGADTLANRQLLTYGQNDQKTKAQSVPYTLYAHGKISLGAARTMAMQWKDRDVSDLPQPNKVGLVPIELAEKTAEMWRKPNKVGFKEVMAEFSNEMQNLGKGWLPIPIRELAKGLAGGLGLIPGTEASPDTGFVGKASNFVGSLITTLTGIGMASKVLSGVGAFGKVAKAGTLPFFKYSGTGIQALDKLTGLGKVGIAARLRVAQQAGRAAEIAQSTAKITQEITKAGKLSNMTEGAIQEAIKEALNAPDIGNIGKIGKWTTVGTKMYHSAASLAVWGQFGLLGRELTGQEEADYRTNVKQAASDIIFGGILGYASKFPRAGQSLPGYTYIGGATTAWSLMQGAPIEDAVKEGIIMTALHGMGYSRERADPRAKLLYNEVYKEALGAPNQYLPDVFPLHKGNTPVPDIFVLSDAQMNAINKRIVAFKNKYPNHPMNANLGRVTNTTDALFFAQEEARQKVIDLYIASGGKISQGEVEKEVTRIISSFNELRNQTIMPGYARDMKRLADLYSISEKMRPQINIEGYRQAVNSSEVMRDINFKEVDSLYQKSADGENILIEGSTHLVGAGKNLSNEANTTLQEMSTGLNAKGESVYYKNYVIGEISKGTQSFMRQVWTEQQRRPQDVGSEKPLGVKIVDPEKTVHWFGVQTDKFGNITALKEVGYSPQKESFTKEEGVNKYYYQMENRLQQLLEAYKNSPEDLQRAINEDKSMRGSKSGVSLETARSISSRLMGGEKIATDELVSIIGAPNALTKYDAGVDNVKTFDTMKENGTNYIVGNISKAWQRGGQEKYGEAREQRSLADVYLEITGMWIPGKKAPLPKTEIAGLLTEGKSILSDQQAKNISQDISKMKQNVETSAVDAIPDSPASVEAKGSIKLIRQSLDVASPEQLKESFLKNFGMELSDQQATELFNKKPTIREGVDLIADAINENNINPETRINFELFIKPYFESGIIESTVGEAVLDMPIVGGMKNIEKVDAQSTNIQPTVQPETEAQAIGRRQAKRDAESNISNKEDIRLGLIEEGELPADTQTTVQPKSTSDIQSRIIASTKKELPFVEKPTSVKTKRPAVKQPTVQVETNNKSPIKIEGVNKSALEGVETKKLSSAPEMVRQPQTLSGRTPKPIKESELDREFREKAEAEAGPVITSKIPEGISLGEGRSPIPLSRYYIEKGKTEINDIRIEQDTKTASRQINAVIDTNIREAEQNLLQKGVPSKVITEIKTQMETELLNHRDLLLGDSILEDTIETPTPSRKDLLKRIEKQIELFKNDDRNSGGIPSYESMREQTNLIKQKEYLESFGSDKEFFETVDSDIHGERGRENKDIFWAAKRSDMMLKKILNTRSPHDSKETLTKQLAALSGIRDKTYIERIKLSGLNKRLQDITSSFEDSAKQKDKFSFTPDKTPPYDPYISASDTYKSIEAGLKTDPTESPAQHFLARSLDTFLKARFGDNYKSSKFFAKYFSTKTPLWGRTYMGSNINPEGREITQSKKIMEAREKGLWGEEKAGYAEREAENLAAVKNGGKGKIYGGEDTKIKTAERRQWERELASRGVGVEEMKGLQIASAEQEGQIRNLTRAEELMALLTRDYNITQKVGTSLKESGKIESSAPLTGVGAVNAIKNLLTGIGERRPGIIKFINDDLRNQGFRSKYIEIEGLFKPLIEEAKIIDTAIAQKNTYRKGQYESVLKILQRQEAEQEVEQFGRLLKEDPEDPSPAYLTKDIKEKWRERMDKALKRIEELDKSSDGQK